MTLKTGVVMLKIQLCLTEINIFLKYIQIEVILNCGKFHNITVCTVFFYCISDQINAALVSIRDFFQKTFAKLLNGNVITCQCH